jgi:hypothetical protein
MGERWTKADKIAATAAFAALITAATPIGLGLWHRWESPDAAIVSPANGAKVANNTFAVSGTAEHIPQGDDLWLIVRAGDQGQWYPAAHIVVDGSRWRVGKDLVCPGSGIQDLVVFLIPAIDDQQLFSYMSGSEQSRSEPVLSLPPQSAFEASANIDVPAYAQPSC